MGAVRKVASYLGLGGTEQYDESYDYEDEVEGEEEDWQPASERAAKRWRAMTEPSRIVMLTPRKYNDAPIIGRHFREGQTVIMDVNGMSTAEATRMVDFAAGLAYGCEGRIERIAEKVFLLAPAEVEITTG
ncbi:cell division protein SepF [Streptosporangium subroseum]|jgi:cell division inhibitor SepF|uniref:Cell division protein SepF n=1 Tax=Streptosporangium subroseum TaxID=106412 RepID=A0A239P9C8_9ACTN|nr:MULTISPECIES: cell division protein SepF [Streptosporangium]AWS47259.1 cell division protein SepF [Streptosporangium sp. 'caverna']WSA17882.1 cell division protein SepF [Streptosporangium subroseum]SNT63019.1 cell division inhibitor SepF [Streptosporangium subroseum]